jgi:transcriptional regulator with XRE-family HTH domain
MNSIEFAEIIKQRREELGITQKDLAEMSGMHLRSISTLESGVANPTLEAMTKVGDVLGLEILIKVKGAI